MKSTWRWPAFFMTVSVVWALSLPLAAIARSVRGANAALLAPFRLADLAGAVVCHQRGDRTFDLAGQPLPVCARCTGIYVAAAAAFLVIGVVRPPMSVARLPWTEVMRLRVLLAWALLPTAATVIWEWTTGVVPGNLVRASAGAPIGAVVAWIVAVAPRTGRQSG